MRSWLLAGCVTGLIAPVVSIDSLVSRHLEIVDMHGAILWSAPIDEGEAFDIAFVHSYERVLWTQHYATGIGRNIHQTASTFAAFGAGMPLGDLNTPMRRSPTGYVVASARDFSTITIMNSRQSRMTLHYRERQLPISQWFRDYESFIVRIQ